MEEVDKAWLAAAIDGEGSITIPNRQPVISVANGNREFLEKVHRLFGCDEGVGIHRRVQQRVDYISVIYRFTTSRRDLIMNVLPQIIPYMIVKKSNAIEMMHWFETGKYDASRTDVTGKSRAGKGNLLSNSRKGNWGNSKAHSRAAIKCRNNHLKGNWGNSAEHSVAAKKAFAKIRASIR